MKDVKQDLTDRLLLLRSRYEVAFRADAGTGLAAEDLAAVVEAGLHDNLESALAAAHAIVDPADLATVAFWQTPLGVLLFAAGGFPHADLPQTLAARVLGCSRQYVSEMVKSGKLAAPHAKSRLVSAYGVRELLRRKLDKFVN